MGFNSGFKWLKFGSVCYMLVRFWSWIHIPGHTVFSWSGLSILCWCWP